MSDASEADRGDAGADGPADAEDAGDAGDGPDEPAYPDMQELQDLPAAGGPRWLAEPGGRRLAIAWLAAVAVLVAALIYGVTTLRGDDPAPGPGEPVVVAPVPDLSSSPAAPPSPSPSPSLSPSPSPTPSASPSPRASTTTPSRSPQPARFGPVTFEAEAAGNSIGGSAWVASYPGASGGSIVRNIGDWDAREGDGVLRFENVTVPAAGTYTLRLFVVNIDNERTRTAVVTVSGGDPRSVTVSGSSTCCESTSLRVELSKGRNTVTIANSAGHAPSIDRIVVSLP